MHEFITNYYEENDNHNKELIHEKSIVNGDIFKNTKTNTIIIVKKVSNDCPDDIVRAISDVCQCPEAQNPSELILNIERADFFHDEKKRKYIVEVTHHFLPLDCGKTALNKISLGGLILIQGSRKWRLSIVATKKDLDLMRERIQADLEFEEKSTSTLNKQQ